MDKLFFRISVIVVGLLIVLVVIIPMYAYRNPQDPFSDLYMCIMGFDPPDQRGFSYVERPSMPPLCP